MQIRKLQVKNFRGIRNLDWDVKGASVCLIGKGDSTKTTILQAIWYTLFPNWNLSIYDTDFFNQETENPIEITTTIGELTPEMIQDTEFGQYLRGWNKENGLVDEPDEEDENVISIKLTINKDLQPTWEIVNDRQDSVPISQIKRAKIGVTLLGDYLDRELSWTKGSSLARSTGELDGSDQVVVEAVRKMREAISQVDDQSWKDLCDELHSSAKDFGVNSSGILQPGIDTRYAGASMVLRLFDGKVPISLFGLGSKRLFLISLQHSSKKVNSILLADEIESGLEPHRLRHLIRKLRPTPNGSDFVGQSIFTTHSEIAVVECQATELKIVTNNNGNIKVCDIPEALQSLTRTYSEAFLGCKVIVCEGDTENGFCRSLDRYWETLGNTSFAYDGVVIVSAPGGKGVGKVAQDFKELGYKTAIFADSDQDLDVDEKVLEQQDICVIRWADKCSIEERIALDLPVGSLQSVMELALVFNKITVEDLLTQVGSLLSNKPKLAKLDVTDWITNQGITESELRIAVGKAAKLGSGWFKRIGKAEKLGELVTKELTKIPKTDLFIKIDKLMKWSHE